MKFKSILLTGAAALGLTSATMAQVPNYVPTNGLIGYYPFTGNANDLSGISNNGTVNGATLTTDRFGNINSAYLFNGTSAFIDFATAPFVNDVAFTISVWIKRDSTAGGLHFPTVGIGFDGSAGNNHELNFGIISTFGNEDITINNPGNFALRGDTNVSSLNTWMHLLMTKTTTGLTTSTINFFLNGTNVYNKFTTGSSLNIFPLLNSMVIGKQKGTGGISFAKGIIDDIGIWNRELTQQEISDLYNAVNCANNTTITPQTNSLATGSTASYTATTSDQNPSYVWQSDLGQGFQTLNNFGNYSGANSATLNISNVQVSEHNQPIRVISTSGNCIDTSNVAVINILDTCITNVTIYDTLLTTVTDTLVINATITGINPPNNLNTLKVFPNPANTHITIDYGNFNAMSGYILTIGNSVGQTVFTTPINQQTSYIDLSTWTGNGIYFVQLIDPQNNTIENRKIVIQ